MRRGWRKWVTTCGLLKVTSALVQAHVLVRLSTVWPSHLTPALDGAMSALGWPVSLEPRALTETFCSLSCFCLMVCHKREKKKWHGVEAVSSLSPYLWWRIWTSGNCAGPPVWRIAAAAHTSFPESVSTGFYEITIHVRPGTYSTAVQPCLSYSCTRLISGNHSIGYQRLECHHDRVRGDAAQPVR